MCPPTSFICTIGGVPGGENKSATGSGDQWARPFLAPFAAAFAFRGLPPAANRLCVAEIPRMNRHAERMQGPQWLGNGSSHKGANSFFSGFAAREVLHSRPNSTFLQRTCRAVQNVDFWTR